jgi:hypothetical protein
VSPYDLAGVSPREGEAPPGFAGGGGDVSPYKWATQAPSNCPKPHEIGRIQRSSKVCKIGPIEGASHEYRIGRGIYTPFHSPMAQGQGNGREMALGLILNLYQPFGLA